MDEPEQEALHESLRQVGLTRYEASVYLGLVTDQSARVAEISRRTGVPQPKVYQALDALVDKGFCALGTDSVNRYRPIAPSIAIEGTISKLKRQQSEAATLAQDLEGLLLAGQGQALWAPPIEVVKGSRQIIKMLSDCVESATKEILYYGKSPQIPAVEMARAIHAKGEAGISLRLVFESDYLTPLAKSKDSVEEVDLFRSMKAEVRTCEHLPTKLLLVDRSIAMLSISRSGGDSFLVLVMRQKGFVEHILAAFDHHWEQATPVS